MENKDCEFAKKVVLNDAEEEHNIKEACSKDDEAAERLHRSCR